MEDLEIDPGTVTERDLQKSIVDHLRSTGRNMVGANDDPVYGWTWDICTQYYVLPDPARLRGLSWAYPVLADAGTPLRVKVLYLSSGGNPSAVKLEMAAAYRQISTFLPHCTVEMASESFLSFMKLPSSGAISTLLPSRIRTRTRRTKQLRKT